MKKAAPLWSILIPAVPMRIASTSATAQFLKLSAMASGHPVEVLMLADNKRRTVGKKRQALLDVAKGKYVSWVDDDDFVSPDYIDMLLPALDHHEPDVVVFPIDVTLTSRAGVRRGRVDPGLDHPNEELQDLPILTLRKPAHLAVWKREIAVVAGFPDLMWGEDRVFMERACAIAKTWVRVDRVLYHYMWNETVSEAPDVR